MFVLPLVVIRPLPYSTKFIQSSLICICTKTEVETNAGQLRKRAIGEPNTTQTLALPFLRFQDMERLSRRWQSSTVQLRLVFQRGLHPFAPPSVEIVRPHFQARPAALKRTIVVVPYPWWAALHIEAVLMRSLSGTCCRLQPPDAVPGQLDCPGLSPVLVPSKDPFACLRPVILNTYTLIYEHIHGMPSRLCLHSSLPPAAGHAAQPPDAAPAGYRHHVPRLEWLIFVVPAAQGPLLGALCSHPMLRQSNWDPWRSQTELFAQIRTFLEVGTGGLRSLCVAWALQNISVC